MILIVFAQQREAAAAVCRLNATPIQGEMAHVWAEGHIPCCYRFDKGWIVISNVGLHAAQMAVSKYGHRFSEVWNLGFAGSLNEALPLGTLYAIETVGKYIPLEESLDARSKECLIFTLPHLTLDEKGGKLISSDFPIFTPFHKERLKFNWDLVDMEGYGIAFACRSLGKKCRMWKIISDFASPEGRGLARLHRTDLSEKIADHIITTLSI